MKEIWKDIKGYEGLYQVSNFGRIKSVERNIISKYGKKRLVRERIMISSTIIGYEIIHLYKNGGRESFRLHRLVAEAFLNKNNYKSMPDEDRNQIDLDKLEINHKDENKLNNHIDNLEFCTSKYNCNYGKRTEKGHQKQRKKVCQFDLQGNFIKCWNSRKEIHEQLGLSITNISNSIKQRQKTARGYIWKYADDNNLKELR